MLKTISLVLSSAFLLSNGLGATQSPSKHFSHAMVKKVEDKLEASSSSHKLGQVKNNMLDIRIAYYEKILPSLRTALKEGNRRLALHKEYTNKLRSKKIFVEKEQPSLNISQKLEDKLLASSSSYKLGQIRNAMLEHRIAYYEKMLPLLKLVLEEARRRVNMHKDYGDKLRSKKVFIASKLNAYNT